jgi:hypothetical protein
MAINYNSREEFYQFLYNEIRAEARIEDDEKFEEEIFVERMIEYLHESNFLENGQPCRHKSRGMKVDGYDFNATGNSIDILVSQYVDEGTEIGKVGKKTIDLAFKRAKTFLEKSRIGTGIYEALDDSDEALDLANTIKDNYKNLKHSRIIFLTNGMTGPQPAKKELLGKLEVSYHVWDFERLWRAVSSGMKKEVITLDFEEEGHQPLKYISNSDSKGIYTTYMALIKGSLLRDLYDRYGTRLLERNVRAFLQARSNVNRGIRDTIIEEPNMFLAFNNGITVTANKVSIETNEKGNEYISRISDFQVVNGGQTVASLWHTNVKNKAKINDVYLQMKLTVINNEDNIDIIAPLISKYSNAQNAVNTADFSANDPFHRNLEKVAQSIYAPDPTGGNMETIWFYERSRGSYAETKNGELTPARMRTWQKIHPTHQRLDKLIIGKLENTWRKLPHIVCWGAQKNFSHFMVYVSECVATGSDIEVNVKYFKDIVAKRIIWKATEKIINKQKIPGYRAQIVTYSLAWTLVNDPSRFDLKKIWSKQNISELEKNYLNILTRNIRNKMVGTAVGNPSEWFKSNKQGISPCWEKVREMKIDFDVDIEDLKNNDHKKAVAPKVAIDWSIFEKTQLWFDASDWIEETKELEQNDADFCRSIGKLLKNRRNPSIKQMPIAISIMQKAVDSGFVI